MEVKVNNKKFTFNKKPRWLVCGNYSEISGRKLTDNNRPANYCKRKEANWFSY